MFLCLSIVTIRRPSSEVLLKHVFVNDYLDDDDNNDNNNDKIIIV